MNVANFAVAKSNWLYPDTCAEVVNSDNANIDLCYAIKKEAGLAHEAALAMNGRPPLEGPLKMEIAAEYVKPKSWSRRKAAATKWKTLASRCSQLAKIIKDTLSGIVYADDAQNRIAPRQKTLRRHGEHDRHNCQS